VDNNGEGPSRADPVVGGPEPSGPFALEQFFVGPLPHPAILAGYEQIQAGLAERIVAMTEIEGAHRRTLERDREIADTKHAGRGQWMAFGISLLCLAVAAWVAVQAGAWAAAPFALGGGVYPLVAAFLRERAPTRR